MITGQSVYLRLAVPSDAAAILEIRLGENRSKFLSPISPNVEDQAEWLKNEQIKIFDKNFVICDATTDSVIGTISYYESKCGSGVPEWGRWVCSGSPIQAIESIKLLFTEMMNQSEITGTFCATLARNSQVVNLHNRLPYSSVTSGYNSVLNEETIEHSLEAEDFPRFIDHIDTILKRARKDK